MSVTEFERERGKDKEEEEEKTKKEGGQKREERGAEH